jgi:hypothetical protein
MASAAQEREALRLVIESRVPQSTPSLGTNGRTRAMSVTDPASSWPTRTESRRGGRGHRGGLSRRRYRRSRDVSKTRPRECNLCRPKRLSEFDDGAVGGRRAQGPSWGTQRTGPPTFGRPGRIGTTLRRDRMAASLVSPRKRTAGKGDVGREAALQSGTSSGSRRRVSSGSDVQRLGGGWHRGFSSAPRRLEPGRWARLACGRVGSGLL